MLALRVLLKSPPDNPKAARWPQRDDYQFHHAKALAVANKLQ
jgi:hypothetical protein